MLELILFIFRAQILLADVNGFSPNQCQAHQIGKGEGGQGLLRYCDDGKNQRIFLSGEMDSDENEAQIEASLRAVIGRIKKRAVGKFEVITFNAGGGDMDLHQKLIMAVEDACVESCRIVTEVRGFCESACNQLHVTCVQGARTIINPGGKTCEHATTGENCHDCDFRSPRDCQICNPRVAVAEYKDRCGRMVQGRNLKIDTERKKQIETYADRLAENRVFSTESFTCQPLPWAERQVPAPAPVKEGGVVR